MASGFLGDSRLRLAVVLGLVAMASGGAGAQVSRLSQIELPDGFPTDTHHGWKFIRFGPDGRAFQDSCRP